MMRLTTLLIALMFPGLAYGQTQSEPFITYWLSDTDPTTAVMYDPLLVLTSVPLEQLDAVAKLRDELNHLPKPQAEAPYILDQPALFLETYKGDSVWNPDGRPIKPFYGKLVPDNREEMLANGRRYKITSAETADVIRLLQNPEGTIPLHRRHAPIRGAERSIQAIVLLLKDRP